MNHHSVRSGKKFVVSGLLAVMMLSSAAVPVLSNFSPFSPATVSAASSFTWNETPTDKVMYLTEPCRRRQQPTTASANLGVLPAGSAVHIVAVTDQGFYKLEDGSYMTAQYMTESNPASTAVSGSIQEILNSAPLNPQSTGVAKVDQKIQEVFQQLGIDSMPDTYSKVKAIYDYIINTTSYGTNVYPCVGYGDVTEGSKGYIAWNTMATLDRHIGPCNKYTSTFIAMVRMIGLDAGYIDGYCSRAGGGMTGHVWAEVYINGQTYIFDPQVEDNMTVNGNIRYDRFCKTTAQMGSRYGSHRRLG